jgi:hypothetical protein
MFRLKWQKRNQSRKHPKKHAPLKGTARRIFHGVSVVPGDEACDSVCQIANVRFLADDAPMLPLAGCEHPHECRCRYQHFDDRRTDARRESDVGLPMKDHPNEARSGHGRRVTDG